MSRWKPEKVSGSCSHPDLKTSRSGTFIVPRVDYCPRCHLWVTSTVAESPEDADKLEQQLHADGSVECSTVSREPLDLRDWKLWAGGDVSSPLKIARKVLQDATSRAAGRPLEQAGGPRLGEKLLVVGDSQSDGLLRDLFTRVPDLDPRQLGFDGYVIKHLARMPGLDNEVIVLAGENPRAAIYAACHFEELLQSGGVGPGLEIRERPAFQFRGGNSEGAANSKSVEITVTDCRPTDDELLGLMRRRVNLVLLRFTLWQNRWVRFEHLPEVGPAPDEIEMAIAELKEDLERVKRFGLLAFIQKSLSQNSWADAQILEAHPDARAQVSGTRPAYGTFTRFCPSHPFFDKYLEAEVRELWDLYPELDGVWTFHGYDGGSLACDCERCKNTPYSQRLVDMHRVTYEALRKASPEARYFLDFSGVDFYGQALVSQLPEDIHYSSWGRFPTGYAWPFVKVEDRLADFAPRYFAQLSTQSEGLVGPNFPLIDFPALAADVEQYERRGATGLVDHHPLVGGALGDPDRYFDPAEPQHEAFLAWAWKPGTPKPASFFAHWAARRFPRAATHVARGYKDLARAKEATLPWLTMRAGFSTSIFAPLDWTLLEPELKFEASFVAHPDGPHLGRENPYGYPPRGELYYVYDRELRDTPITPESVARWLERFDATDHTQSALDHFARAHDRDANNWHLARLRLSALGWHALARAYRDYLHAGLQSKAASGSEWLASIEAAYHASLEHLVAPYSTTLLWSRWFQKMFRVEWSLVLRKILREHGRSDDPFDAFGGQVSTCDQRGADLVLGWSGEVDPDAVDWRRWQIVTLGKAANLDRTDAITDFPDWFTDDPHVPKKNPPRRLMNVPAGWQEFFGVPFKLESEGPSFALLDQDTCSGGRFQLENHSGMARIRGVHFLLAGVGRAEPLDEVATARLAFASGECEEVSLRYWREVVGYKFPETTPESGVAWLEIDESYEGHFTGQVIGFSHYLWKNDGSSTPPKHLELRSTSAEVRLLVLGITVEFEA